MKKYLLLILLLVPFTVFAKATIVSGNLDTVGSVVKIADEEFYVIGKQDATHVKLLAKYNIGVGYSFYTPTNRQEMKAYCGDYTPRPGGVNNSGFNDYIAGYVDYLNTQGVSVTGRLFKRTEYTGIYSGSSGSDTFGHEFLYLVGYWTDSEYSGAPNVCHVNQGNSTHDCGYYFTPNYHYGVRPLIVLEVNGELEREPAKPQNKITTKLTNSAYHLGDTYTIGDQEFYVMGKQDDTHLKLLAKYNLGVGNGFSTPTNRQESSASGYDETTSSFNGTLGINGYWDIRHTQSSLRKEYGDTYPAYVYTNKKEDGSYLNNGAKLIDDYVAYLKEYDASATGRMIKQEELVGLGCDFINKTCMSAPEWVRSTSYWTGTAAYSKFLYYVTLTGKNGFEVSSNSSKYGLRPVITVEIPEEPIPDSDYVGDCEGKVKGVEDVEENPFTGIVSNTLKIVIVLAIAIFVYFKVYKKTYFNKYNK